MKKISSLLTAAFLAVIMAVGILAAPAFAAESQCETRLYDQAGLLTADQASSLLSKLDEISERQQCDVAVVTVENIQEGYTVEEYADAVYEELMNYGYGSSHDGIMLLLSMGSRDWYIETEGLGIDAITDSIREDIADAMMPDLQSGNYAGAFTIYAEMCDANIDAAREGKKFPWGSAVPISFVAAFVLSLLNNMRLKSELKSVAKKTAANDYTRQGSLQLTEQRDTFLYNKIDRVRKETKKSSGGSTTHTSSSGRTHGGGGGKF